MTCLPSACPGKVNRFSDRDTRAKSKKQSASRSFQSGYALRVRLMLVVPAQPVLLPVLQVPMEEQRAHDLLVGVSVGAPVLPDRLQLCAREHHLDVFPFDRE